jgi:hypothetical protein
VIIRGLKIVTHPDIVNFPISRRFPDLFEFSAMRMYRFF